MGNGEGEKMVAKGLTTLYVMSLQEPRGRRQETRRACRGRVASGDEYKDEISVSRPDGGE